MKIPDGGDFIKRGVAMKTGGAMMKRCAAVFGDGDGNVWRLSRNEMPASFWTLEASYDGKQEVFMEFAAADLCKLRDAINDALREP